MKNKDKIPVNDGGGLYDNLGLIDTLVLDCRELFKDLVSGDYVAFEVTHIQMIQKLSNLKTGVENDTKALQARIKELEKIIADIQPEQTETGENKNVQS